MITRNGGVAAAGTVTLLAAGALADYPELVMFGLAGVAAFLVAAVWMTVRPRVTATREIRPQRVTEGEPASGLLTVRNTGSRRSPPLTVTETVAGREVQVLLPSLAAGHGDETEYPLPTARRGRYVIPALTIGYSDPLRLLQVGRRCGAESVLYVHPRGHPVAPIPTGGPRDVEGPASGRSPQGGAALHSLREYQPGDDWRLVDWKSTARTGTLVVRHNVVPDEPRQLIVLDTSAEPYRGASFEEAVRIAASLCVAAGRSGFPLSLRTTGDPVARDAHWHDTATVALDLLAAVRCAPADQGMSALVDVVRDVVGDGSEAALAIVTGLATAGHRELIASVRPWFLTACLVQVGDEFSGQVEVSDGVIAVRASSCAGFAATWNALMSR